MPAPAPPATPPAPQRPPPGTPGADPPPLGKGECAFDLGSVALSSLGSCLGKPEMSFDRACWTDLNLNAYFPFPSWWPWSSVYLSGPQVHQQNENNNNEQSLEHNKY